MVAAVADERELQPVEESLIARLADVQGGDAALDAGESDEPSEAPAAHPKKARS